MGFFFDLLYSQFFVTPSNPTSDFSDQIVIVTGSNTGLGLAAAKRLIQLNCAKVILAVRSISKGYAAVETLVKETHCEPKSLDVWELDLSSFDSIRAFGDRVRGLKRLDAVLQNAGIHTWEWRMNEGFESTIATNVIGPALLGLQVLPKLQESATLTGLRGRLAFNGSDLMYAAKFEEKDTDGKIFDVLNNKENTDAQDR